MYPIEQQLLKEATYREISRKMYMYNIFISNHISKRVIKPRFEGKKIK
jgi:hypothetical protein